jgi:ABC-type proline/glycine betaine transport system permease subunit
VIGIASVLQTIPSLALLALMIPFFRCREISGDYRTVYLFTFADFAKYLYRDEKC